MNTHYIFFYGKLRIMLWLSTNYHLICFSEINKHKKFEPQNKMTCAPSEDSDQPGHLPSLIRVFAVRMKKPWVLSYPESAQWTLWSDWADAQADLSLRWAHMSFCLFCHEAAHFHLSPRWKDTLKSNTISSAFCNKFAYLFNNLI